MTVLLGVMFAGALGAVTRYLLDGWVQGRGRSSGFPLGTLIVNVSGSFLLGVIVGVFLARTGMPESVRLALGTGFVGAYTTFSTWMLETVQLVRHRAWGMATLNLLGSVGLGMVAATVGLWLGGML